MEKIKEILYENTIKRFHLIIAETYYDFGTHYVLIVDSEPCFHSTDYDTVFKHMKSMFFIDAE